MEKLLPFAVLIAFPFMWCAVLWFLAQLGGWSTLAERYRARNENTGKTFHMRSAKFGLVNYSSCLSLTVNESGLRLAVLFPFRIAHPPLFIPWSEIHGAREKRVMFISPFLQVDVGRPVMATLLLPKWVRQYMPTPVA